MPATVWPQGRTHLGPAEYSAAAAVAGLGVALAVFAGVQVIQAKQLREERARPYVIVDFEFRRYLVQVAIGNISRLTSINFLFEPQKKLYL